MQCDRCPLRREATERRRSQPCEDEAEMGVMQPQAKECLGPQKLEETRKSLWRECGLANTLILDSWPPQL